MYNAPIKHINHTHTVMEILFIATTNNVSTTTPCGGKWRDQLCDRSTNVHKQDIYDSTVHKANIQIWLKNHVPDDFKPVWLEQ